MVDASLKIKMDFAESSEILRTSLKLKGAPVALGFATTKDDIPSGMSEIDERVRHCMMVSLARNEGKEFYATADKHECNGGSFALGPDLVAQLQDVKRPPLSQEYNRYDQRESPTRNEKRWYQCFVQRAHVRDVSCPLAANLEKFTRDHLLHQRQTEQGYKQIVQLAKHWNAIGDEIHRAYVISDCARCAGFGVPRDVRVFYRRIKHGELLCELARASPPAGECGAFPFSILRL